MVPPLLFKRDYQLIKKLNLSTIRTAPFYLTSTSTGRAGCCHLSAWLKSSLRSISARARDPLATLGSLQS
jgi:hypothetical protein